MHLLGENLHVVSLTVWHEHLSLGGLQTNIRYTGTTQMKSDMLRECFEDPCGLHRQMMPLVLNRKDLPNVVGFITG